MQEVAEEEDARREAAAQIVGGAVGAAFAGGLANYFKIKGQENIVQAAEAAAKAVFGFGTPAGAAAAAAIPMLLSTAAKWFALAGAARAAGIGGGGGSGVGGGAGLAGGAGAGTAARTDRTAPEINLYIDPLA